MAEKAPEEIMAEHLLKGGKMLARTCPECGSPLFSVQNEELCVVCGADRAGEATARGTGAPPAGAENTLQEVPAHASLLEAVTEAIITLAARVPGETEPRRCRELMQAIHEGAEAIRTLRQG